MNPLLSLLGRFSGSAQEPGTTQENATAGLRHEFQQSHAQTLTFQTEMERRMDVYKKEAETARKWSASLANLHHIKVNLLYYIITDI